MTYTHLEVDFAGQAALAAYALEPQQLVRLMSAVQEVAGLLVGGEDAPAGGEAHVQVEDLAVAFRYDPTRAQVCVHALSPVLSPAPAPRAAHFAC